MAEFKPMYDRVLVCELDVESIVDGIYLPETARQSMLYGVVNAVGEGYVSERGEVRPLRLKVGDKVTFGPWAGMVVVIEGVTFKSMREGEVIGVIA